MRTIFPKIRPSEPEGAFTINGPRACPLMCSYLIISILSAAVHLLFGASVQAQTDCRKQPFNGTFGLLLNVVSADSWLGQGITPTEPIEFDYYGFGVGSSGFSGDVYEAAQGPNSYNGSFSNPALSSDSPYRTENYCCNSYLEIIVDSDAQTYNLEYGFDVEWENDVSGVPIYGDDYYYFTFAGRLVSVSGSVVIDLSQATDLNALADSSLYLRADTTVAIVGQLIQPPGGLKQQIPTAEYDALVELYVSTDGANWNSKRGWLEPLACSWHGVYVSGVQLDSLGNVIKQGHVTSVALDANALSGTLPLALGNLTMLQSLTLSHNKLTKPLPDIFTSFSHLLQLDLSANAIDGFIPPSLGQLSLLQQLNLSHNSISGELPDLFATLSQLVMLDLSYNAITGPIPPSLGQLSLLQQLNLNRNRFFGSLAPIFTFGSQLIMVDVSNNALSGVIPQSLDNLSLLESLNLANNSFTGDVKDFSNLPSLYELTLTNNWLDIRSATS